MANSILKTSKKTPKAAKVEKAPKAAKVEKAEKITEEDSDKGERRNKRYVRPTATAKKAK